MLDKSVIGAVLLKPSVLVNLDLTPDDFTDENLSIVFKHMLDMYPNTPIDVVTLSNRLSPSDPGEWLKYLTIIQSTTPSAQNVATYAKQLKEQTLNNKKISICQRAALNDDNLDSVISELMELTKSQKSSSHSLIDSLSVFVQQLQEHEGGLVGIDTGFKTLNQATGGFRNGDLYTFGGRPSMGKTSLLIKFALSCDVPFLFFSAEQPHDQIAMRMLAQQYKINAHRLRNLNATDDDYAKITKSISFFEQINSFIYDKNSVKISKMKSVSRQHYHDHGIKIIFIDYAQLFSSDQASATKSEEINEIIRGFKEVARELHVPVVNVAQVNREVEKRPDKRPMMSDLKGSGAFEEHSDFVGFVYRDYVYHPNATKEDEGEIIIDKNRHGPVFTFDVSWDKTTMTYSDKEIH